MCEETLPSIGFIRGEGLQLSALEGIFELCCWSDCIQSKGAFVVMFAGAALFVLPISAEGLVVFAKEEFTPELFHNGLVEAIPGVALQSMTLWGKHLRHIV